MLLENKTSSTYGAIGENNQELKTKFEELYIRVTDEVKSVETVMAEVRSKTTSLTNILIGLNEIQTRTSNLSALISLSLSVLRASRTG
jgi:hypothetical protein